MDAILQTLHELEGVNGTIVADNRGQVLAYKAHAVYDATLLQQASRAIVTAIDSIKLLHPEWESISAQFGEGRLLIRSVAPASRNRPAELTLSLIADMRLNISFAGVALRVAVAKLASLLDTGLTAPALPLAPNPPVAAAPAPVSPPASWPNAPVASPAASNLHTSRQSSADGSGNGLSWSGFGASSGISGSGITALDAASSAVLAGCTKALARSVGPMAKRYVKQAVVKVCGDRPFTKDQMGPLISELEKYLENPADVAQFRQLALKSA
jgi:hypothetical protein